MTREYVLHSNSWWLRCAGSAAKSGSGSGIGTEERQVQGETNLNANQQREMQRISTMQISKAASTRENEPADPNMYPTVCFSMSSIQVCVSNLQTYHCFQLAAILWLCLCVFAHTSVLIPCIFWVLPTP